VLALLPEGASHRPDALAADLAAALPTGIPAQPCHNQFLPQDDLTAPQRQLLVHSLGPSCAGGPIGLLDLDASRAAARALAQVLHHRWTLAVRDMPPARPWRHYHQQHRGDPTGYPLAVATAQFTAQPRITAMINHSRLAHPVVGFRVDEFDAGLIAHQNGTFGNYLCGIALFGDALSTSGGQLLSPDQFDPTGRGTFHVAATRILHTAHPGAVAVACHLYL
jgi:hypothetical protein